MPAARTELSTTSRSWPLVSSAIALMLTRSSARRLQIAASVPGLLGRRRLSSVRIAMREGYHFRAHRDSGATMDAHHGLLRCQDAARNVGEHPSALAVAA